MGDVGTFVVTLVPQNARLALRSYHLCAVQFNSYKVLRRIPEKAEVSTFNVKDTLNAGRKRGLAYKVVGNTSSTGLILETLPGVRGIHKKFILIRAVLSCI